MAVTRSALNGYYKKVYGQKNKPLPSFAITQRLITFKQRAKIGSAFEEVVFTRRSHGVTFARTTAGTVYALNNPRSIQTQPRSVTGAEIVMREQIAYGAIAASEGPNGEVSFGSSFDEAVLGIEESHRFYLEANSLYGRTSIGTIDVGGVAAGDSATNKIITISKQTFAPGLWQQAENALLDAYDAPGGTKRNTNGAITVRSFYDVDARKISLDFVNAADVPSPGDVLVFVTADAEVMYGMDAIITNATTMFGIDASLYSVWRGNKHDCGGTNLTMSAVLAAQTKAVVRGGMGAMNVLVNPWAWQDLADDQAALRRYGEASTKFVNGAEVIEFNGTGGRITFEQHPMVKCGEGFMIQAQHWIRGGESDLVDKLRDASNDDFFHEIPGYAGSEMRNFSSQFLFCRRPASCVKLFNITPRQLA